jgi:hypothetical protein
MGAALCRGDRDGAVNRQSSEHMSAPEELDATIYSNSLNLRQREPYSVIKSIHFRAITLDSRCIGKL